jgi:hypothetical protein
MMLTKKAMSYGTKNTLYKALIMIRKSHLVFHGDVSRNRNFIVDSKLIILKINFISYLYLNLLIVPMDSAATT